MKNSQPREKRNRGTGAILEVHSIFQTIQGEGPFAGRPAVFLRLAGCNLQCPHCDTDYTTDRRQLSVGVIVTTIRRLAGRATLVVITGGEPFRQRLAPLVRLLHADGFAVQLETNGTLSEPQFPYELVTVVCSPKTGTIAPGLLPHIAALKYVIAANDYDLVDGLPDHALDHPAKPRLARPPEGFKGRVYVQPEDSGSPTANALNLQAAMWSCQTFGYWLCLQQHKIIGVP